MSFAKLVFVVFTWNGKSRGPCRRAVAKAESKNKNIKNKLNFLVYSVL